MWLEKAVFQKHLLRHGKSRIAKLGYDRHFIKKRKLLWGQLNEAFIQKTP